MLDVPAENSFEDPSDGLRAGRTVEGYCPFEDVWIDYPDMVQRRCHHKQVICTLMKINLLVMNIGNKVINDDFFFSRHTKAYYLAPILLILFHKPTKRFN